VDSGEPNNDNNSDTSSIKFTIPYGDPFSKNHKVLTPGGESSTSSSWKTDLKTCEFTPESRNSTMCSPQITPILENDDIIPRASTVELQMDINAVDCNQGLHVRYSPYTLIPREKRNVDHSKASRRLNLFNVEDQDQSMEQEDASELTNGELSPVFESTQTKKG